MNGADGTDGACHGSHRLAVGSVRTGRGGSSPNKKGHQGKDAEGRGKHISGFKAAEPAVTPRR